MTLRMPLAAILCALLALILLGGLSARPASAHTIAPPGAAYEASEPATGPLQVVTPREESSSQSWVWLAAGAFVVFAVFGGILAVFGYMEATRRDR